MKKYVPILLCLFIFSQVSLGLEKPGNSKKVLAIKITEPIVLDGKLIEKIYESPSITDFTQRDPDEGKPASEKTEVWVFYDDHNFYVSAKLYDSRPDSVTRIVGRRDEFLASDYFGFAIDTYLDRRNAFFFLVNPMGAIIDGQFFNDGWDDETWDGVWDYGVSINADGWSVEIKVPFSQLRFKKSNELIWGINFYRRINRKQEEDHFVLVSKKESGFVSHFATLYGLIGIQQKQRIEFLPYIVGKSQFLINDPQDPFYKSKQYLSSFGSDFKIGIGSNLTLDGTINPDFGQVEVDPAVINLTAFETYFVEKRPFFIEGSQILRFGIGGSNNLFGFNWRNPELFYSRRIGRSPRVDVTHDGYVDYPTETRILGAAKLTGKLQNDISINFLNAFTERTYAIIDSQGYRFQEEVEPFTYYGVFRTQKEFNSGRQSIGFISTTTIRDNRNQKIDSKLVRNAFTYGVDGWTYLDKNDTYVLNGYFVGSYLKGSNESIIRIQRLPQRYLQRPDAKKFVVDSSRTYLNGFAGRVTLNKQKGNFYLNSAFGFISPNFEINDLGFLSRADVINSHLVIGYRWYDADKYTRRKSFHFALFGSSDFEGNLTNKGIMLFGGALFKNFYSVNFDFGFSPEVYQKELTRGGPLTKRPEAHWYSLNFETDESKDVVFEISFHREKAKDGSNAQNINLSVEYKPSPQLKISVEPSFELSDDNSQWITNLSDSLAVSTYGYRYLFGRLNQKTLSANIRLNYTLNPKLTLQIYTQPLISAGKYIEIKELKAPRTYSFNVYGKDAGSIAKVGDEYLIDPDGNGPAESFTIENPDFNYKSLRLNVILRWEFSPGSSLYFVWSHGKENFANPGDLSLVRDLKNLLNAHSNNVFLLKLSYWLDI